MIIKTIVSLGLVAMVAFSGCSETAVENLKESGKAIKVHIKYNYGAIATGKGHKASFFEINSDVPFTGLGTMTLGKETGIGFFVNGVPDGLQQVFQKDQMMESGYMKDGEPDGLYTRWYDNGQKKSEKNYKDGKKDGLSTSWDKNGQKKSEVNYKNGKQDGLSTSWDKNGQKN